MAMSEEKGVASGDVLDFAGLAGGGVVGDEREGDALVIAVAAAVGVAVAAAVGVAVALAVGVCAVAAAEVGGGLEAGVLAAPVGADCLVLLVGALNHLGEQFDLLVDEFAFQLGCVRPQFLDDEAVPGGSLLVHNHTLLEFFVALLKLLQLGVQLGAFRGCAVYLFPEQAVLLQQFVLDVFIGVQPACQFAAGSLVLVALVLGSGQCLLQLWESGSQDGLSLSEHLQQLPVLLVLLGQQQEILSLELPLELLRDAASWRLGRQHFDCLQYRIGSMEYLRAEVEGEEAAVVRSLLDAVVQIAHVLRHSPVVVLESTNKFGDQQLHQDVLCDQIVEKHLRNNPQAKAFASEERPHYHQLAEGQGFVVTYDPLDGSSVIDTNFAVGSIFSIWRTAPNQLLGSSLGEQVNALIAVYGPRTTAILFNPTRGVVQELTLLEKEWVVSHDHLVIRPTAKMFSPGNLRAVNENADYEKVVAAWIKKGYTLRYTGGLVPDVAQIFVKGNGVLSNIGSHSHKCKLRALYEAAAVGFLVERAGGKSITSGRKSLMEYKVSSFDDRLSFAVGSAEEIDALAHLF